MTTPAARLYALMHPTFEPGELPSELAQSMLSDMRCGATIEREAIVAWLRKHYEDTLDGETGCLTETSEWADKIEAGEHLKSKDS